MEPPPRREGGGASPTVRPVTANCPHGAAQRSAAQRDALLHVHAEQQQHEERLEQPLERDALVVPVERTTAHAWRASRGQRRPNHDDGDRPTAVTERDVLLVPGCVGGVRELDGLVCVCCAECG